ncbi:hypothetical protein AB0D08_15665 [Kitasatospora sp. NPDC048540]|uniref:Rv1733c family protein n=1 Tax=unclassified Kitasatospora TaxID=2633591 RepID=UPI0006921529|nr:hypothetical protein [Kitasatospora sp. MBT63]
MARRPSGPGSPIAHTTLRGHLCRAAGRDANPLCRTADRSRSRLLALFLLGLVLSLAAGLALAALAWRGGLHEAAVEAQHRHRTTATTQEAAVPADSGGSPADAAAGVPVEATWVSGPTGQVTGWVSVTPGTPAGSTVPVWVGDDGRAVPAPRSGTDIVLSAAVTGVLTTSAVATVAALGCALRYRVLDRRAVAAWEPAWERVEPLWSGRTPGRPGGSET